jgi:hypothetical protein
MMMKTTPTTAAAAFIVALLLSLLIVQVSTFSLQRRSTTITKVMLMHSNIRPMTPITATTKTMTTITTTMLHYTIVSPPDNDNCELGDNNDSNCEESFFARKRQEKKDKDLELRNTYNIAKNGLDVVDSMMIDLAESVDQYRNAAGSGIIPGIQLSSLMLDD